MVVMYMLCSISPTFHTMMVMVDAGDAVHSTCCTHHPVHGMAHTMMLVVVIQYLAAHHGMAYTMMDSTWLAYTPSRGPDGVHGSICSTDGSWAWRW